MEHRSCSWASSDEAPCFGHGMLESFTGAVAFQKVTKACKGNLKRIQPAVEHMGIWFLD